MEFIDRILIKIRIIFTILQLSYIKSFLGNVLCTFFNCWYTEKSFVRDILRLGFSVLG